MSTGQDRAQGNAIMQKRGFCLPRRVHFIQPRDFRAPCNQRQHRIQCRCRKPRQSRHDALQRRTLEAAAVLVKIPIGDSIDRGDDAGSRSEQRLHRLDDVGDGMRLQANDHKILRPKFGGIVGVVEISAQDTR
jgi:hypothetical protein